MPLNDLGKLIDLQETYPALADQIGRFAAYLRSATDEGAEILPANLVAHKLGVTYATAVVLLNLAENLQIVSHSYQAYSLGENFVLGEFDELENVGESLYCPDEDRDLDRDQFYLDLVFKVIPEAQGT